MRTRKTAITEEDFKGTLEGKEFMSPSCGGTVRIQGGRVTLNGYEDVTDECDWSKLMDEYQAWNIGGVYQKSYAMRKISEEDYSFDANGQPLKVGDTVKPTPEYDSGEYAGATGKVVSVQGYGAQVKVKWDNGQTGWNVCRTVVKTGTRQERKASFEVGDKVRYTNPPEGLEGKTFTVKELGREGYVLESEDGVRMDNLGDVGLEKVAQEESDEEESMPEADCPVCGGPGVPLGGLGNLMWYRCRNCGMDFNQKAASEEDEKKRDEKTEMELDLSKEGCSDMVGYLGRNVKGFKGIR